MRPTVFQKAELRDENDNIVQQGTYGKGSALSNSTNDAWIDYVMNNLEALRSMSVGAIIPVETLPESGETGKAYVVTTGTDAGKLFMWDGEDWVEITGSIGDYLPITGGTITGNLAVTGNATLSGTSTAVTPNADDNSTKVATTEYVQTEIKPIETDVTINDKRIENIEKLLQGNLYDYQTDNSSAYTKSVPTGAMPYAGLEKVCGKTIVMNQEVQEISSSSCTLWDTNYSSVTYSNGTALISTINNSTSSTWWLYGIKCGTHGIRRISGHKYFTSVEVYSSTAKEYNFDFSDENVGLYYSAVPANEWTTLSSVYTTTKNNNVFCTIAPATVPSVGDIYEIRNLMFIDLTLMFGAENEPTLEQCKEMFPASYYPFNAGTLLSAGVTSVVSEDGNNATLQTYPIPASVQALEDYGVSVSNTIYNYIDVESKKFIKKAKTYTIQSSDVTVGNVSYANVAFYQIPKPTDFIGYGNYGGAVGNLLAEKFVVKNFSNLDDASNIWTISAGALLTYIWFGFPVGTTLEQAQSVLNGIKICYALTTETETDISAYLTDDNLIQVESGGTLTFENQHGDDYRIPVPSVEEYMIDLQASL